MALVNLSVQTMVMISSAWIDAARERPQLEAMPLTKALLGKIESAHAGVVATQRSESAAEAELTRVREKEAGVDQEHDACVRGLYGVLSGFAEIAADPAQAEACLVARNQLFPAGLRATNRSYLDEAGEATLARARLSPEATQLLSELPVPGGNAGDVLERWFEAGRQLGELESERRRLEALTPNASATALDVLRARNAWIKVARALETTLELEGATDEVLAAVLGPMQDAEAIADRRVARKGTPKSAPIAPPPPAHEPAVTPDEPAIPAPS